MENKEKLTAVDLLRWAAETFGDRVALASSFGAEDVVLIDLWSKITPRPRVFTLDTGRLPQETYQVMEEIERRYNLSLEVYFPDTQRVEEMVRTHGINLFYKTTDLRKLCCHVRKVEPLERALSGLSAWITGLRREQSAYRTSVPKVEEELNGRVKVNPLADWTEPQVWSYIHENRVPYNKLHDQGYPSIGCAPCTRPIQPGEDPRAGRWWWENNTHRECGLHVREQASLLREAAQPTEWAEETSLGRKPQV